MARYDEKKQLKCSFCGKTQEQVKRLVAGPGVYICDECIELCSEIIEEEFDDIKWNIFNILGENMLFSEIDPNAQIVRIIYDDELNEVDWEVLGASLGYQDMAWLDGIPMMFFIPLMSMREIFYIFSAIIALCTMLQFFVANAYSKRFNAPFSLMMLKY